jgi:hypothetical protein
MKKQIVFGTSYILGAEMDVKMLPAYVEAYTLVQCGIDLHVSLLSSSSSSSSLSLFFSINPIIDTYHEDVEMVM